MRVIQEKNRLVGRDTNIKINLSNVDNLNGFQQNINNYVDIQTELAINPVVDGEKERFIFEFPNIAVELIANFNRRISGSGRVSDYAISGIFTEGEITTRSEVIRNSFYVIQLFDSVSTENQTLLHNSYIPILNSLISDTSSNGLFNTGLEYSFFYLSKSFLNNIGSNQLYARFLFFNAKTGQLIPFYNANRENNSSYEKLYYDVFFNRNSNTYDWGNRTITINEFSPSDYTNKIDNTLDSANNESPRFPNGNQFNPDDGTYEIVT